MPEDLTALMDAAAGACDYADARHVAVRQSASTTRNGARRARDRAEQRGHRRPGAPWAAPGASPRPSDESPRRRRARPRAGAGGRARRSRARRPPPLAPVDARARSLGGPVRARPVRVSRSRSSCELLLGGRTRAARRPAHRPHRRRTAWRLRTHKAFASTEGAACTQVLTECGGGIQADRGRRRRAAAVRSYPSPRRQRRRRRAAELVLGLDLVGEAPRVAEEALALLTAPALPGRRHDADPRTASSSRSRSTSRSATRSSSTACSVDEAVATPARSWVAAARPRLAALRVRGAEHHRRRHRCRAALGTFGWDDEGVAGPLVPLDPRRRARAASCPRASRPPRSGSSASGGCTRAEGWARQPIVRMTNVSIEPGDGGHARRPGRRHRRGHLPGDQPLVVDRRPPPPVPVRHRDRPARSRGGELGRACTATHLRRDHAAILGGAATPSARRRPGGSGAC